MSALRFIEDLWSPQGPDKAPPKRRFLSTTLGGVKNSVWDVARFYLYEGLPVQGRAQLKHKIEERHKAREGARMNFMSEFVHLGEMTKEGLMIGIVGKGGHVTSLYYSKHGERTRSLCRDTSRALFANGTLALVVDEHGRGAVTAVGWNVNSALTFAEATAAPAAPTPKPQPSYMAGRLATDFAEQSGAPPASPATQARLDDNARVAMARTAILNGRWGSPPRPS